RRPPPTTLFPYTTLFRSDPPNQPHRAHACARARGAQGRRGRARSTPREEAQEGRWHARRDQGGSQGGGPRGAEVRGGRAGEPGVDRKSTRLNSSHVKISY